MINNNNAARSVLQTWFAFIVPSLIGVFLFMTPVAVGEAMTIPIAVMAKSLQAWVAPFIQQLILAIVCITAILSIVMKLFKPQALLKVDILRHLFDVSWIWLITRVVGMIFIVMTFFAIGPEAVHSSNTGALVLHDLLPVLFSVFI